MMASSSSSSFFGIEPLDGGGESETCRHAMDACSLCGKHLAGDCDIFMYRGDTPFCSEECRYHQMVRDDFKTERRPARKEEQRQRRRHQAPAAAEPPAHVPLAAANVPVAI
ncbi:hypothetical protein BDA96_04G296100 [Sorghum bicolor]|uniref:FLZ-type domain-containing protein n=2 Tax=Sorghum bicolor TaxID=4558 RepID=A0A921R7F0_SORBI|nr:uncharacterized protein LOC8078388 [Sorghum bicolor]KAG0534634.1 hypothetical protein BDA96_04G296100 [Sorghum bicolor]KXG30991.1 hypothetical protein SORBI_3004G278100 [Sorghum bicolor]|eukprot:XP_021315855.1 uncharacterized protein LOC8078388 [Sorghum bicolor]